MNLNNFDSIIGLLEAFPNEQSCIDHLENLRWPNGVISPDDSASTVYNYGNNQYRCKNTGKDFNVRTGTMFGATKVPLQKWFVAIHLSASGKKGISSLQLAREIKVTQKTAWFMLQRIRGCYDIQEKKKLTGVVEMDESFVGGKNKNRHRNKKVKNSQGRSFKDKTPVFGMLERGGYVRAFVVPNTGTHTINRWTLLNVSRKAKLYTDEWGGYDIIKRLYRHEQVDHGRGQYVNGNATTNSIEGFWSHLKRGIIGIYHYTSRKHLQRYVNEFTFRYNTRNFTTEERFNYLLGNAQHRLTYSALTHG